MPCPPAVLRFSSDHFGPVQAWELPWTSPLSTFSPGTLLQPYHISWSCPNLSMALIPPLFCNHEPSMKIVLPPFLSFQPFTIEDTNSERPSQIPGWLSYRYPWLGTHSCPWPWGSLPRMPFMVHLMSHCNLLQSLRPCPRSGPFCRIVLLKSACFQLLGQITSQLKEARSLFLEARLWALAGLQWTAGG